MRFIALLLTAILGGGARDSLKAARSISPAMRPASHAWGSHSDTRRRLGHWGKWLVQAEGANKFLAQMDADSTRARFPVAMLSDVTAADVDLSVRFRPISGRVDQAAGLVWRYREDNYYVVRANALEDNIVVYKVENGKRTDLPVKGEGRTYGKKAEVPAEQWSTLRAVANEPRFDVYFNGTKLYEVEDGTFTQAGRVGVWTKADSVTQFDDLTVVTR